MVQLIGRENEQGLLKKYIDSNRAEFIAVYGRRRVGKTFLVTETFKAALSFDMTGVDIVRRSLFHFDKTV